MRKGKDPDPDPDPYLWLMDPDPGGPKTQIRITNTDCRNSVYSALHNTRYYFSQKKSFFSGVTSTPFYWFLWFSGTEEAICWDYSGLSSVACSPTIVPFQLLIYVPVNLGTNRHYGTYGTFYPSFWQALRIQGTLCKWLGTYGENA